MNIIYTILIALGFLPFLIILYKMNKVRRMKSNGVKVTGIVRQLSGSTNRSLNSMVIEYPVTGTNYTITKQLTVAGMPYQVGDELPLYYDSKNPEKMLFDSGKSFIMLIVFTLLIAAFFIFACVMISKRDRKSVV